MDDVLIVLTSIGSTLVAALLRGAVADAHAAEPLRTRLCDDGLFVKHEDAVLGAALYLAEMYGAECACAAAALRAVRLAYVSPRALAALERWLAASPHAHADLVPHVSQQLTVRAARQDDARLAAHQWGSSAWLSGGAGTPTTSMSTGSALIDPSLLRPRHAYAFTVDSSGASHLGAGAGIFFIWIDPAAPLACNEPTSGAPGAGLPARYASHVRQWGGAYGDAAATVFNGAQCWLAVREAAAHPEYSSLAPSGEALPPLAAAYAALAARGAWIQCVDIARVAIAWLAGGPSVYLDTDMSMGPAPLPPALVHRRGARVSDRPAVDRYYYAPFDEIGSSSSSGGGGDLTPPATVVRTPLLVLAQDADGLVQNNFIGVAEGAAFHPFLTLALRAMAAGALDEPHVLHATGPALLTALFYATRRARVALSPSCLLLPSSTAVSQHEPRLRGPRGAIFPLATASAALASLVAGDPAAMDAALSRLQVPIADDVYADTLADLPRSAPDASFGFVPRVAPFAPRSTAVGSVATDAASLFGLVYGRTVHLCPPSAFYPRHWRVIDAATRAASDHNIGNDGAAKESVVADALLRLASRGADLPLAPGRRPIAYGAHSWDCTWGGGESTTYYYYVSLAGVGAHLRDVGAADDGDRHATAGDALLPPPPPALLPRSAAVYGAELLATSRDEDAAFVAGGDVGSGGNGGTPAAEAVVSGASPIVVPTFDFVAASRAHDEFGIAALARRCARRLNASQL